MPEENIMKYERTLPPDFDGIFRFTNWSDEEFVGVWNKKEYHFPANATSPMIIPEHSPLEVQHIRKKFAKDLAEREFFKGKKYGVFKEQEAPQGVPRFNSIHQAATYTLSDLSEGIQKCLSPLEIKRAAVTVKQEIPLESKLTTNDEGELNTQAVGTKTSLKERALKGKGLPSVDERE